MENYPSLAAFGSKGRQARLNGTLVPNNWKNEQKDLPTPECGGPRETHSRSTGSQLRHSFLYADA